MKNKLFYKRKTEQSKNKACWGSGTYFRGYLGRHLGRNDIQITIMSKPRVHQGKPGEGQGTCAEAKRQSREGWSERSQTEPRRGGQKAIMDQV